MEHEMKLQPEYYNFILNGTKRSDKSMTKEELIAILEQLYTKEKQEQYGVLGIRVELI